jgi:hypothetical protein
MCRRVGAVLALAGTGLLALSGGCSDDDSSQYYDPLTDACDQCLSADEDDGCASLWLACDEDQACSDFVLCQLRARCYEEQPDSSCETRVGCTMSSDASSQAQENAVAFEACARTECAKACGYRPP